jgi:microcystin-dependent protein
MTGPSGSTPNGGYPFPTQDDDVDVPRDMEALARAIDPNASAIIIGEVRTFGLAAAPARWLTCDGSAVEQAAYPELYAALGGRFNTGGESPTQFRLPAVSGRSIVGSGAGSGLTARAVADRWGAETVALALTEIPNHNHGGATGGGTTGTDSPDHTHSGTTGVDSPDHSHSTTGIFASSCTAGPAGFYSSSGSTQTGGASARHTHSFGTGGASARHNHTIPGLSIAAQGGGGGHNNLPPSIALLVCIYAGR